MRYILFFITIFCSFVPSLAKKNFVYCIEEGPKFFNPQLASDFPTFAATSRTIYNRLVDFKPGTSEVVPSLAESWLLFDGGKRVRFNLRKDVSFHSTSYFKPSKNFSADDVVFTFKRMADIHHPFHKVSGGNYIYFVAMEMSKLIKDVKKVNSHTVDFYLRSYEAPFLSNLAMDFASILSSEYGAQLVDKGKKAEIDNIPIGTGPFRFKKYLADQKVIFDRHEEYFGGKAAIDRLIFNITPESSVQLQKLKKGECHLITSPTPSQFEAIRKYKNLKLVAQPGLNIAYLAFNMNKKPFDNRLIREAVGYALNRKSYIEKIYSGHAELAKSAIPPLMWGYNDNLADFEYNPEKAKALIKKSKVKFGQPIKLWYNPKVSSYFPNGKKLGELMQEDLKKVGFSCRACFLRLVSLFISFSQRRT